jgi:hypothetical protein
MAKDIEIRDRENALPDNFVADIRSIIEQGRQQTYAADRQAAIATFWNVGRRIVEEEQKGESRAEYGTRLIPRFCTSVCKIWNGRIYRGCCL